MGFGLGVVIIMKKQIKLLGNKYCPKCYNELNRIERAGFGVDSNPTYHLYCYWDAFEKEITKEEYDKYFEERLKKRNNQTTKFPKNGRNYTFS